MNVKAFSELKGASRTTIYAALKRGELHREPSGEIDPNHPRNADWLARRLKGGAARQKRKAAARKATANTLELGRVDIVQDDSGNESFRLPVAPRDSAIGDLLAAFVLAVWTEAAENPEGNAIATVFSRWVKTDA